MELARDAAGTLIVRVASGLLALTAAVLLARKLGAAGYGAYAWAIAWVTILSIPGKLGMDRLLVRNIAIYVTSQNWAALRGMLRRSIQWVLSASIGIAVVAVLVAVGVTDESASLRTALLIGLLMLPLVTLVGLYQGGLQGLRRVVLALVPDQIVRPSLFLVLVVGLPLSGIHIGAVSALALQGVAAAVGLLMTWALFSRALPPTARRVSPAYESRAWSASALSMVVISAVVLIYARLDVIMLGALRGAKEAGVYSSAVSVASVVLLPLGAANMALAPLVPRLYAANRIHQLRRQVCLLNRGVFLATLLGALLLGGLATTVLGFFGGQFTTGAVALQVLLAAQVLTALASANVMLLTMTHNEHATAMWITAAASLNIVLDLLLIPPWGLVGSSIATFTASTLQTVALTWLVWRRLGIDSTILGIQASRSETGGMPSEPLDGGALSPPGDGEPSASASKSGRWKLMRMPSPRSSHRIVAFGARASLTTVTATVALGAILGAAVHPLPRDRFRAEAVVAVQAMNASAYSASSANHAWRLLVDAVKLPQVAQAIASAVPGLKTSEIASRVETLGSATSGLVRIRARGDSVGQATELANEVAGKTVSLTQSASDSQTAGNRQVAASDFQSGTAEGWLPGSIFSLPVNHMSVNSDTTTGRRTLAFSCGRRSGSGCGPGLRLAGFFDSQSRYRATAYVRALGGRPRLRVVLGSSSKDVSVGRFVSISSDSRYHPLSVSWTPREIGGLAVLALQSERASAFRAAISSASVRRRPSSALGRPSGGESGPDGTVVPAYRYASFAGASPISAVPAQTPRWLLFGGLIGFGAGGLAVGCALAAQRQRERKAQQQPNSDV